MRRPRRDQRRRGRLGFEPLESRVVLTATAGPPVWDGGEVIEPTGIELEFVQPAAVGTELWTPKAELTSAGSRLHLNDTSVAELQARAADPAYADIWGGLTAWSAAWPTSTSYGDATEPFDLNAEDPWRSLATSLEDTLMVYVAAPDAATKAAAQATLSTWVDRLGDWFDADNLAPAGSRSAATPTRDLSISQLISFTALGYDWLKNDPGFSETQVGTLRSTLIQLTRSLEFDQGEGGEAEQWIGSYADNHNWWNFWALSQAGAVLYGESGGGLGPDDAERWLGAGIDNFYYVFADLASGGSPNEGYLYNAYADNALFGMNDLVNDLVNVGPVYQNEAALNALSSGVLYSSLPNGAGNTSYYQDNLYNRNFGAWSQHYLASEFGNEAAQLNGNRLTATTSDAGVDWQSMLFYDPAVPEADVATLPTFYDDTDMGLYYARSSWDDTTDPTVLQYHAGPDSGQSTANGNPPWGLQAGHVTPGQGHVILYSGENPVLPSAGYPEVNSTLEYNAVVFDARDGQGGRVGFDGEMLGSNSGPIGQQGGDSRFLDGTYFDSLDHARTLRVTHDEQAGVHAYLSDLGGRYRLNDLRSPTIQIDPSYQRYVFYLESGAVAIVDRVKVDYPRDIYFRLPVYDGVMVQQGDVFSFATIDGVAGTVENHGSTTDGTLAVFQQAFESNTFPSGESDDRNVVTLLAQDATEAVFSTVVGVGSAGQSVQLSADEQAVVLNGVTYDWAELARGDTSPITFEGDGYLVGEGVDDAPFALGQGRWSVNNADNSETAVLKIAEEPSGNAYLAAQPWSPEFATVAQGRTSFNPIPQDTGATSWDDVGLLDVSFDLRLDDANLPGQTTTAWEIEIGADTGGLSGGVLAKLRVLSDGSLEIEYGGAEATVAPLTPGVWSSVDLIADYATKTFDLSLDGSLLLDDVGFDLVGADNFGSFRIELGGAGQAGHRLLGIDNLAIARVPTPEDDLAGVWSFDGVFGDPELGGTAVGDATLTTAAAVGLQALSLDGSGDRVVVADDASLRIADELTLAAWVNPDAGSGGNRTIVSKSGIDAYHLRVGSSGRVQLLIGQPGNSVVAAQSSGTVTAGEWTHLAATFDAGEVRFYTDGVLDSVQTVGASTIETGTGPLVIGARGDANVQQFDGRLDEVRVYSEVLDPSEIATLAAGPSSAASSASSAVSASVFATLAAGGPPVGPEVDPSVSPTNDAVENLAIDEALLLLTADTPSDSEPDGAPTAGGDQESREGNGAVAPLELTL